MQQSVAIWLFSRFWDSPKLLSNPTKMFPDGLSSLNSSNLQTASSKHTVAIMMCTYNGERFIEEQLESIFWQSHLNFELYISDDCSADATVELLIARQKQDARLKRICKREKRVGSLKNFLSLVCSSTINAEYFAFADQDDIWDRDKLSRAIQSLSTIPATRPALYCGRTRNINQKGDFIGLSPLWGRAPGFRNALVQNIASGNTMVINKSARDLLMAAGPDVSVPVHDWWAYLLVSACGGYIFYDTHPTLSYRQHDKNQIGSNFGFIARFKRFRMLVQGVFRHWVEANIMELSKNNPLLATENLQILQDFARARDSNIFRRLWGFYRIGIYRQSLLANIALLLAVVWKKI
jgi:glycosyltransferase involved in cell wall biosynthesis